MLAVFKRELKSFFYSASAYMFLGVFLFLFGFIYAASNLLQGSTNYQNVVETIKSIFMLLVPVITMRIISEDTHQKTDQLLYTSPITLSEVVIGKYFAELALFGIALLVSFIYPLISSMFGTLPVGEIVASYLGFALFGAALIAIGTYISSLTENMVVSAVATFGVVLFVSFLDYIIQSLPTDNLYGMLFLLLLVVLFSFLVYSSTKSKEAALAICLIGVIAVGATFLVNKSLYDGFIAKFLGWFSLMKRNESFGMGIINISDIVYNISFSVAFLYLTIRNIEKRRWS